MHTTPLNCESVPVVNVAAQESSKTPNAPTDRSSRFFKSDHLKRDLQGRTHRSGAITVASQGFLFALNMGTTMVLARQLVPEDFGLIAMVQVVTGFLQVFRDGGLSMATIQQPEITHEQVSVLFWLNLGLSGLLALVAIAIAPAVAWIYSEPRLTMITATMGLSYLISGSVVQHRALMARQMQFGRLAMIATCATITGSATAIVMAWSTRSYWALVAIPIVTASTELILIWYCCRWMPSRPRRGTGANVMVRFGGNYMAAQAINYVSRSSDNFIIGITSGSSVLGVYAKAYGLLLLPLRQFLVPISSVTVPALSRLTNDPTAFRKFFLRQGAFVVTTAGMVVFYCAAAAPELVCIVLGDQWSEAVPIFWCLAPGAFLSTTNICGTWVCATHGLASRQRNVALFAAPTYLIAFLIGSHWGGIGVAAGYSIACGLIRHPVFTYCLRDLPILAKDIWGLTVRPMIFGTLFLLASGAVAVWLPSDVFLLLAVKSAMFLATLAMMVQIGWLPGWHGLLLSFRVVQPNRISEPA
tara:strand:- start:91930 stop:93513 length:1584 start_codon:yes stop_codon:yes gene_type:complete